MTVRKLDKGEWKSYFDRLSKQMDAEEVEIEVASLDLGDQIEAEWLPLIGITYDPKDDILEVALEELDHVIEKPSAIYIDEQDLGIASLEVVDADGIRHIVKLREMLMLPAP